ncbi:MAG: type I DNA topoisomerase [Synergistaceae bacterium]|nr:type I DNA topoisomerase [Synergistaceae bacterium]
MAKAKAQAKTDITETRAKSAKTTKDDGSTKKPKSAKAAKASTVKGKPAKASSQATPAKGTAAAKKPKTSKTAKSAAAAAAASAGKTLVIVESPAKAKTLEKILGRSYHVEASIGHVRDLPKARLAVDVENDFAPEYINVRGKADLIKTLKAASEASAKTLLASDPDREGEAIAWHLATLLEIDPATDCRIRMQEITAQGVKNAVSSPDHIDMDLVDAQQSRRVLDRLVGYNLSPLLWYKVSRGLSAGRVQSVALRIVCEREDEIEAFVPQEYWLIDVLARALDGRKYALRVEKKNKKPFVPDCAEQSIEAENVIKNNPIKVESFKTKEAKRGALPPFKTSVLQQEASRRLGYSPRRTMRIAQSLYEGVEIPGRGPVGLITYMRTDSLRLAPEAIESSRNYIKEMIGSEYLPEKPNSYTPKGKAQDAHEAIRATDPFLTPESLKEHLRPEQFRLYDMIWRRFIASQMTPANVCRTTVEASSGEYGLKQAGIVVLFQGWGKVWPLGVKDVEIPPATAGEQLFLDDIKREQKFTQPPARYTDAGLVKVLEEKGIGRPSTYASIIETIADRGYVNREEDKKLAPTKLGRIVNTFLVKHFPKLINMEFTAGMENQLDSVEAGHVNWIDVVRDFWGGFKPVLDDVSATAERVSIAPEEIGEPCPECGKPLVIKRGRFGEFIACSGYPECKYTRRIVKTTGVVCPKCGQGELIQRKAGKGKAKGRSFYGCSRYPECDYASWKKPTAPESGNAADEGEEEAEHGLE